MRLLRSAWPRTRGWMLVSLSAALLSLSVGDGGSERRIAFANPIDALSIGVPTDDMHLAVSALQGDRWTPWQALEIEKEFDPLLKESNLVIFPEETTAVRVRGTTRGYTLHPIRIAEDPPHYAVAARSPVGAPRILSRNAWGADESLLFEGEGTQRSDTAEHEEEGDTSGNTVSPRVEQCAQWQEQYPEEFETAKTVEKNRDGEKYRWPQAYSPSVTLLVVHHTALKVTGDTRPAYERMRALYAYHANGRMWGDIGYHFVIDETGQIYEGRAGGKYVVGGHAYCSNVGTIGIALMGNFDVEQPTQNQMQSLQWLLRDLAGQYDIDLEKQVSYHGMRMDPVVGHGTLVSTACPGYYVTEVLSQIRRHVRDGDIGALIRFPAQRKKADEGIVRTSSKRTATLTAVGSTQITGLPGGQARVSLLYRAGDTSGKPQDRIADVLRSDSRIGLWQDIGGGRELRVRQELLLPSAVRKGGTLVIALRVQLPRDAGTYSVQIGDVSLSLVASGKRVNDAPRPAITTTSAAVRPQVSIVRPRPQTAPATTEAPEPETAGTTLIRIRLGYQGNTASLAAARGLRINGKRDAYAQVELQREGGACVARQGTAVIAKGTVRVEAVGGAVTIASWQQDANRFRGTVECRVLDGQLVLINELPLESYLAGLAEEPDTEPYEKQRAFAVAARSYAAHYLSPSNRKFPGMPYDGDDSAARFQLYGGLAFEEGNPAWVRAVRSTASLVLMKNGAIVKTPYFSSDDGRTRSPAENGWANFPFAEVFASKPDPWCAGMELRGHGVGMSGCGARGQAVEGKTAEQILEYYYPGAVLRKL